MSSALDSLSAPERELLEPRPPPSSLRPMKATLTDRCFSHPDWLFEPKLDGVRCAAFRTGEGVKLVSRTGRELEGSYPELVEALGRQPCEDFVVDGEIVAFEGAVTSFARLQRRMQITDPGHARHSGIPVFLYLFDLVHLDGHDTRRLVLRARKSLLRRALSFEDPVRFTPHRNERGEEYYREACRRRWEGLIAKRAGSPYLASRSRDWLKLKCTNQQELVIGGYTEPRGSRSGLGALLLGYWRDGELVYAGKVGTGFDERTLRELRQRLHRIERRSPPFAEEVRAAGAHWVRPELVAQIRFSEWTRDGRLRHPRFLGLREDKPAREVVRESAGAR